MMAGIQAYNGTFLADLSNLEARIANVNNQISSGFRVNQASDDPAAVAPIISYQGEIDSITQVQTNLSNQQVEAQSADGALQNAATLLDQLVSLGSTGASSTTTAASRTTLGQQVQDILQQLVTIANTSVNGRYVFGGDASNVQPYTYNWGTTGGVTANVTTPSNTATISDSNSNQIVPRLTAQQIFDVQTSTGTPASGNIFQAAFDLGQALLTNNQSGATSAIDEVKAGVNQLNQASTSYGNIETWIQQASSSATSKLNDVTTALSAIRDSDVATDATQLTMDQTALQASLQAHGNISNKSLFDYLG
jgi:flagellar hook-associated protein 3 FlgL